VHQQAAVVALSNVWDVEANVVHVHASLALTSGVLCVLQAAQLQACEAEAALKAEKAKGNVAQQQLNEQLANVQQQLMAAQQQLQQAATAKQQQVGCGPADVATTASQRY
jgi:hypothetical protein